MRPVVIAASRQFVNMPPSVLLLHLPSGAVGSRRSFLCTIVTRSHSTITISLQMRALLIVRSATIACRAFRRQRAGQTCASRLARTSPPLTDPMLTITAASLTVGRAGAPAAAISAVRANEGSFGFPGKGGARETCHFQRRGCVRDRSELQ